MIDLKFWAGKRVFLTGHTSFKGAWMSLLLHGLGAEVHGFALPRSRSRMSAICSSSPACSAMSGMSSATCAT